MGIYLIVKIEVYPEIIKKIVFLGLVVIIFLFTSGTGIKNSQAQATQNTQQYTDPNHIVKQIAENVASANTGVNAINVEQILIQLGNQAVESSSREQALKEMTEIHSQVSTYPYGVVSQSLAGLAKLLTTDSNILLPVIQSISQEKLDGKSISQSIVDIATQQASGGGKNVIEVLREAAVIISKQVPNVPLDNIESILIQMALQTSEAQGKAITGQTIFEMVNQIIRNPNGVLTQAIVQLANLDTHDLGKTGQTVAVIQKVVKVGGGSNTNSKGEVAKSCASGYERAKDGSGICLKKYDSCPAGSANPEEGCELNGYQCGSQGCGNYVHGICETCVPQGTSTSPIQSGLTVPATMPLTPGKIIGGFVSAVVDSFIQSKLGPFGPQIMGGLIQWIANANPSISSGAAQTVVNDLVLRAANNPGQPQAFEALTDLQRDTQAAPNILQRIGQLAGLYQSGDDLSAAQTSNAVIDKLSTGIDPAVAISETPIPQPTREPNEFSYLSIVEPLDDTTDNEATEDLALEGEEDSTRSTPASPVDEPESRISPSGEPLASEGGEAATFIPGLPLSSQTEDPCIGDPSLPECQATTEDTTTEDTTSQDTTTEDTTSQDPCIEDPSLPECQATTEDTTTEDTTTEDTTTEDTTSQDPCIEDPSLPECQATTEDTTTEDTTSQDPCIEDPSLPECQATTEDTTTEDTTTEDTTSQDPCIEDPSLPECQESGTNSEEDSADETSEEDPEAYEEDEGYEEDYYYE
jgi:hypothetical protein